MIAVTGASGYIAQALLARLRNLPTPVMAISRSPAPPVRGQERWVHSADGVPRTEDLAGCEALVHLAGRAHVPPGRDSGADQQAFDEANHRLAVRTAAAAAEAGVRRFVFVSTLGVHGRGADVLLRGDSPVHPDAPYARSKWAAEQELAPLSEAYGMSLCVVRPPMVYGPRCPGNFPRLVGLVRRRLPLPFGALHAQRSFIYVDNLAAFLAECATQTVTGTYAIGDGSDWSVAQLVRAIGSELQVPVHSFPVPVALLRLAGTLTGRQSEIDSLTLPMRVDSEPARQAFHWQPHVQPESALHLSLQDHAA